VAKSTAHGDEGGLHGGQTHCGTRLLRVHKISSTKSHRNFSVNHMHYVTADANIGDMVA